MKKTRRINYESDFILHLKFPDDFTGNFKVIVSTTGNTEVIASRIDGVLTNCKHLNGEIGVVLKNHGFNPGRVHVKVYIWYDNEWSENLQIVTPMVEDIILVTGAGDCPNNIDISEIAPFIKGEKGEKGETGPRGPQGPQGMQGVPGPKGDTPSISHIEEEVNNIVQINNQITNQVSAISNSINTINSSLSELNELVNVANRSQGHIIQKCTNGDSGETLFTNNTVPGGLNIKVEYTALSNGYINLIVKDILGQIVHRFEVANAVNGLLYTFPDFTLPDNYSLVKFTDHSVACNVNLEIAGTSGVESADAIRTLFATVTLNQDNIQSLSNRITALENRLL